MWDYKLGWIQFYNNFEFFFDILGTVKTKTSKQTSVKLNKFKKKISKKFQMVCCATKCLTCFTKLTQVYYDSITTNSLVNPKS